VTPGLATRLVVAAYVVIAAAPFAYAATQDRFWDGLAPFATLLVVAMLAGIVLRKRWAWLTAVVLEVGILTSFAFDFTGWADLGASIGRCALIVSPPMRRYVLGR
jgi:hypothetical protein